MSGHHHDHHGHSHSHSHEPTNMGRAFFIAVLANGIFVLLQIIFAVFANSTSLLADAVHNAGDVLSLVLAWIANRLLKRAPTHTTTYGMKKLSIMAALTNGVLMVFSCGIIATEAIYKLLKPEMVQASSVLVVASIGILVNGLSALLFYKGQDDLNIRASFLHLFYDAIISLGVVIAAFIMLWTQWWWVDALVGLIIAVVILKGTWSLFTDSFRLMLDGVPVGISYLAVKELLLAQPGVTAIHDLHIWAMSTKENALSAHLVMPEHPISDEARRALVTTLNITFHIQHVTLQVESEASGCEVLC